ncbi:uncharacterized protein KY384_001735 [Bacidia gigantensis]|uniref:uncharacterized protein n=1 Tax=Bacidia gigantensis TaxID=2732470 RepID=UPI001D045DB4|nr:uncharacterized protein KY384_001735 [Bacidia gigantensis]KAG8532954.1 hypothetical protein KY384_001735 [Bacidia gigantensis]
MAVTKLTALDQVMPHIYTRLILCFPLDSDTEASQAITFLQRGLALTVLEVPNLKATVVAGTRNGEVAIKQQDGSPGTPLLHIKSFLTTGTKTMKSYDDLRSLGMPTSELDGDSLAPLGPFRDPPAPVFAAQANLIQGGLLLCVCFHHSVLDGPGIDIILRRWSENCHAVQEPGSCFELLPERNTGTAVIAQGGRQSMTLKSLNGYDVVTTTPPLPIGKSEFPEMISAIFKIEIETLQKLKAEVNTFLSQQSDPGQWVSSNDVLCAILWRAVTNARLSCSPESDMANLSRLGMAVDGRSKLNPAVTEPYLGNINICAAATAELSSLTSTSIESLVQIALAIRQSVTSVNDEFIRHLIHVVDGIPDLTFIAPCFKVSGMNFAITTWRDMGICDLDWGMGIGGGKVEFTRVPTPLFDGICIVLPKRSRDAAYEVTLGLRTECMASLKEDEEFRQIVSFNSA